MRKLALLIILLVANLSLCAQSDELVIEVYDVDIISDPTLGVSAVGSRISSLEPSIMEASKSLSLSELLSENSGVYIKSYGQGALATSSFRGTNSSHTAVNWNGININPSMSGSFDFSKIPVFFVDGVAMRHGSGGTSSGSGALGGSIYLSNAPEWGGEHPVKAFIEGGSYDTYTAAISATIEKERSMHRLRLFYTRSDNDFRYINKIFSVTPRSERREDSAYQNGAIMQESYFKVWGGTLSSNLWLTMGERELPQPITLNSVKHESEEDASLKYALRFDKSYGNHYWEVVGGYIYSNMDYTSYFETSDDITTRGNHSHRAVVKGRYQYDIDPKLTLGGIASYTFDAASSQSYSNGSVTRGEALLNAYALYKPSHKFKATAEGSLTMIDNDLGGMFSLGMETPLVKDKLSLSQSLSYNRRYPSLNDLYWVPGGNPDLKPEEGISYDLTLSSKAVVGKTRLRFDATYYIMNINEWIVWLPTSSYYWAPVNMKRVVSQGVELMGEADFKTGSYRHRIRANYTYASSQNREPSSIDDSSVGKQLPYIPKHKFNVRYSGDWRGISWSYTAYYTSQRYTTPDNSYSTEGYIINDVELNYKIKTKGRFEVTPRLRVNNLFDEYYESVDYYPMPLRSYSLGATLSF